VGQGLRAAREGPREALGCEVLGEHADLAAGPSAPELGEREADEVGDLPPGALRLALGQQGAVEAVGAALEQVPGPGCDLVAGGGSGLAVEGDMTGLDRPGEALDVVAQEAAMIAGGADTRNRPRSAQRLTEVGPTPRN
jgi:hypothetical protein